MKLLLLLVIALNVGLVVVVANNSNALSYLSESPDACANCHVMNAAYESWRHSPHGRQLVCVDCHVPNDGVLKKYAFKAMDGARHSTIFTLKMEPPSLKLSTMAEGVVQQNCVRCHTRLTEEIHTESNRYCWECHRSTPHQRVHSLTSSPHMTPASDRVARWISNEDIVKGEE